LHRLLGARPDAPTLRYHRDHPLPLDVLVIDEASMVDLRLMAKLVEALPVHARLILVGDRDQLASVEAGAVLSDLCWGAPALSAPFRADLEHFTDTPLPSYTTHAATIGDAVILLQQSYRFGPESSIGQLAHAVQRGEATAALQVCQAPRVDDLVWLDIQSPAECHDRLAQRLRVGFQPYLERVKAGARPADVVEAFDHFRVLCAHRSGPLGTMALNRHIEALLQTAKLLDARAPWYPGRPVMITRNDYHLRLFNGDVGITLPDPEANG